LKLKQFGEDTRVVRQVLVVFGGRGKCFLRVAATQRTPWKREPAANETPAVQPEPRARLAAPDEGRSRRQCPKFSSRDGAR